MEGFLSDKNSGAGRGVGISGGRGVRGGAGVLTEQRLGRPDLVYTAPLIWAFL